MSVYLYSYYTASTYSRRNLEYYDMCHSEKVRSCDSDCGVNSGELTIKIPKETYSIPGLMGEDEVTQLVSSYMYIVFVYVHVHVQ